MLTSDQEDCPAGPEALDQAYNGICKCPEHHLCQGRLVYSFLVGALSFVSLLLECPIETRVCAL